MEAMMVLQRYIDAEYELRLMDNARTVERDRIFSSVLPQYEVLEGMPRRYSVSTENAALELVDLDNAHKKVSDKCIRKRNLLNQALSILDSKELEAYQWAVWEQPSDMTTAELKQYENQALEKLCNHIEKHNGDLEERVQKEHRDMLREQITSTKEEVRTWY